LEITPIPVIVGQPPQPHLPEYREMLKYESGRATERVEKLPGKHQEPWLNALDLWEPFSPVALNSILTDARMAHAVRGRVLDVAAGCCWATARLSQLETVNEVVALDLSRGFLTSVGERIINQLSGDRSKIRFAASSFNAIPFEDGYFDCAIFIATLHHCESPITTLKEICRVLKPGGCLFVIQQSAPLIGITAAREHAVRLTHESGFTELAFTRPEMQYWIRHAGFSQVHFHALDAAIGSRLKRWVRQGLRRLDLEHAILPMLYVVEAQK
jgi:ubiquinone/menaquinone biosynthesis C-methylase UbiE